MDMQLIERLALQAGLADESAGELSAWVAKGDSLAQLVVSIAEECAKRCDEIAAHDLSMMTPKNVARHCAGAIRERFKS